LFLNIKIIIYIGDNNNNYYFLKISINLHRKGNCIHYFEGGENARERKE